MGDNLDRFVAGREALVLQESFGTVLWIVVAVGAVIAVVTFAGAGRLYQQIGRGTFSLNEDLEEGHRRTPVDTAITAAEREEEVRQMLEAANHRRRQRGEEPIDVETEVRRLLAPRIDAALEQEIRDLVIARNNRRARRGEEPLDVETEVARQIRDLGAAADG
jgi:hypothetical protein